MTSKYESVFNNFFGYIDDYDLTTISEDDLTEYLVEWLHKATANPNVRRLYDSFVLDDETQIITYTMKQTVDETADAEFTIDVLAKGMVIQWLTPLVRSKKNINQVFTNNKESKFYSQSAHLSELREMLADVKKEQEDLIADRGFIWNSYLNK